MAYKLSLIICLCVSLAACKNPTIQGCPPVPSWTPEESEELAGEIETLPSTYDMIHRALQEGYVMRRQAEDCR